MKRFEVLGEVYAYRDVKDRKHFNVAQMLGAWAIKNYELAREFWEARYRAVYGGHDPRRADGSTALYASSAMGATLPAALLPLLNPFSSIIAFVSFCNVFSS